MKEIDEELREILDCLLPDKKCCAVCIYVDDTSFGHYSGRCRKLGIYLLTISDRLCEKYELAESILIENKEKKNKVLSEIKKVVGRENAES